MHLRSLLLFCALLPLLVPCGLHAQPAPATLTLTDLVTRVLADHPAIHRAEEDARAAAARVDQARSADYPTVDATGLYTRLDPVSQFAFGGSPLKIMPNNNWDAHVGARQTVYDFGRRRAQTGLSQGRARAAGDAVESVRANLAFAATRAFYTILYLDHARAVQDSQIAALNGHLDVAQNKLATGTALRYDVLTTQVRIAAVENQRTDIVAAAQKQQAVLRELLGWPADAPLRLAGGLDLAAPAGNPDSLRAQALRERNEIRLVRDTEETARLQQRVARLSDRPALNALLQYGVKNGYEPDIYEMRGNWAAGAQVQVPIYNGHRRRFLVQEADAALRSEERRREALERQIGTEVSTALSDLQAALEKLRNSGVRIQQAAEAVSQAQARYASGTATNLDVLDAETAVAEARLGREQALYAHALARTALAQATGERPWQAE